MNPNKLMLIARAFTKCSIKSFADLGGIWGVNGGYTFDTMTKHPGIKATLVDLHIDMRTTMLAKDYPNLRLIHGNFSKLGIIEKIGPVDAIFMFDVLLHQVDPNWDEVLARYAESTKCFVIYNQMWTKAGPSVRLLDLGEKEYFKNVPHSGSPEYVDLFKKLDDIHPVHGIPWRNVHHIWQWGITDYDLILKMTQLGFNIRYMGLHGAWKGLPNIENHSFIFTKKE